MNLELHLRLAGALQLVLAAIHIPFPRWFNWRTELARLSLINRQIFLVQVLFIAIVLTVFGMLSLAVPQSLLEPVTLAPWACAGLAAFWLARLYAQHFIYDRRLWLGSRTRTCLHIAASLLWIYLTATYSLALIHHLAPN